MTDQLAAYRQAVSDYARAEERVRRFADARACAVWALARNGWTLRAIAKELGVTHARICQLIGRARMLPDATSSVVESISGVVVTPDMVDAARMALPDLRRRIRAEAMQARVESLRILEGADAVRITPPSDRAMGEWDWFRGLSRGEQRRLALRWWSTSPGNRVDDVAGRLANALPAFSNLTCDEIIGRVWLYHSRMIDAANTVARGKVPAARIYSGAVDVASMAPGVASDGYSVLTLLGDDDTAARHVAAVDATREQDRAWSSIADIVNPRLGPPAWRMSAESYCAELVSLAAQLKGHDELVRSIEDTSARRDELVPKLLDDGSDWIALHGRIMDAATAAGLN